MLTTADQIAIFKAQTKNVRELQHAWVVAQRAINALLVRGDRTAALLQTKIQALILSAFGEALFSKLVHTPHGFSMAEIEKIKTLARKNIAVGWSKCLELGLTKVKPTLDTKRLQTVRQTVIALIKDYVTNSSVVRNKIAHGQWVEALNSDSSRVNQQLSKRLADLTTIELLKLKTGMEGLAAIIESLIESPGRTFNRDYPVIVARTQAALDAMAHWSLDEKVQRLKRKLSYFQPKP